MVRPSIVDHSKASLLYWRHAVVPTCQSLHHDCNTHASSWLKDHNDSSLSCQGWNNRCDTWFCPSEISSKPRTEQILNQVVQSPRKPFPRSTCHFITSRQKLEIPSIYRNLVKDLWLTRIQDQASQVVSKLDFVFLLLLKLQPCLVVNWFTNLHVQTCHVPTKTSVATEKFHNITLASLTKPVSLFT